MKVLVLGGTGGTGKAFVEQAVAAGHDVTALVRDPAAVTTKHPKLTVKKGQATVAADVEAVMAGQDVVVSALGPRARTDTISADAAQITVDAMKKTGVKRIVWLTAWGVGETAELARKSTFVFGRIIMPMFLSAPYANHLRAENAIMQAGLEWTLVRPVQLMDWPAGRAVEAVTREVKPSGLKIGRADVAAFMLKELEARKFVNAGATICSP